MQNILRICKQVSTLVFY